MRFVGTLLTMPTYIHTPKKKKLHVQYKTHHQILGPSLRHWQPRSLMIEYKQSYCSGPVSSTFNAHWHWFCFSYNSGLSVRKPRGLFSLFSKSSSTACSLLCPLDHRVTLRLSPRVWSSTGFRKSVLFYRPPCSTSSHHLTLHPLWYPISLYCTVVPHLLSQHPQVWINC